MEIRNLNLEDLDEALLILKQDSLRYADGKYPSKGHTEEIINSKDRAFALGLFEEGKLASILISEKLIYKGCIIWYIATDPEKRNMGFGGKLLEHFEEMIKKEGLKWIFLNATEESLNFYKKHEYLTSKYSKVYEHVKKL